jgi:hypothetical protein
MLSKASASIPSRSLSSEERANGPRAFGDGPSIEATSAPLAICVAALLARGIAVEFEPGLGCDAPVVATYSKS